MFFTTQSKTLYSTFWIIQFKAWCEYAVKSSKKLHYLAHPARRILTRVWLVICAPTSIIFPRSHLAGAPCTLLANSSVGDSMNKLHTEFCILYLRAGISAYSNSPYQFHLNMNWKCGYSQPWCVITYLEWAWEAGSHGGSFWLSDPQQRLPGRNL